MKIIRRIVILLLAAFVLSAPFISSGCVVREGHPHWWYWHHP
jgi:hypothetical protein